MTDDITRNAWVVLGGIHLLNQTEPRRAEDPIALVQVTPQAVCVPATTVVVRWDSLGTCPVTALTTDGSRIAEARIEGSALFPDAIAGPALREIVGQAAAPRLVPLCYLAEHPEGGYHAYAQIRFYADDSCFVRTTPEPIGAGPVEALRWLEPVLAAHAASALRLNNHLRYFHTHFAGTELEYKYNLAPTTDIWAVSMELLKDLRHGALTDCRPEYREEFQTHYFDNYMFDVTGPEHERGYASFIPTVNGTHVLKRKWFTQDAFSRREQLVPDIDISPDSFEEYLRSELGLQTYVLPPFRRVRYDIQCESMRTGHVFGIFFDRCSLLAASEVVLSQCEMEYLRSRSLLDHAEEDVLREMERIDRWLLSYLAARGLATQRTFYSKRSFLRDTITNRPDLTPTRRCSPDHAALPANVGLVTADTLSSESADHLRAGMVAALSKRGSIRSPQIAAAFATVPREKFAPEATLPIAYGVHDIIITKRNAAGEATSSVSAPWLQAEMLEEARLERGARVLEIGSGGYNAALIAEIVGPQGTVVTVDIDPFVTERATRLLADTGYPHVKVVLGDAEHAAEPYGPYDAILVTVGAWDCPWGHLLAPAGRLVVPLRFASITRTITFIRDGDQLTGHNPTVCGFVSMQGAGAHYEQQAVLADGAVKLIIDDGPPLNTTALGTALTGARTELWTAITVGNGEPLDTLHLWLATVTDTVGWIWGDPERDANLIDPALRWFCPTLITPDSFAYLTFRPTEGEEDEKRHEFGVYGHGPNGADLAQQLAEHLATWDRTRRNGPGPSFSLHPADATVREPAVGRVFPKRHTQLLMAWPD